MRLDIETITKIVDYLQNASKFEIVETANAKYILAHAGIKYINKIKPISKLKATCGFIYFWKTGFFKKSI